MPAPEPIHTGVRSVDHDIWPELGEHLRTGIPSEAKDAWPELDRHLEQVRPQREGERVGHPGISVPRTR